VTRPSGPSEPGTAPDGAEEEEAELRREGLTMAFYVAICLLAALAALPESADQHDVGVLGIVWGTSLGLAIAHVFAFRLAARVVAGEASGAHEAALALAQLIGAAAIAGIVTVPVVVLPASAELDVARLILGGVIAVAGYRHARDVGASRSRSLLFGTVVIVLALVVAVTKNVLSGH
jgi:hypothetical protein